MNNVVMNDVKCKSRENAGCGSELEAIRDEHAVLRCVNLSKIFNDAGLNVAVLDSVSLAIHPGEQVAIVGASGAGKSTLLHLLGGLDKPSSGDIYVDNQSLRELSERKLAQVRNQYLGFVYQFHHLLPEFNLLENVMLPVLLGGQTRAEAKERALTILEKVGLAHRLQHRPAQLSGGERQRAAIARALVTQPKCVLADEPTGNLDRKTAQQIYETMLELNKEFRTSLVIVTHDPGLASRMDKVYTLDQGKLV